MASSLREAETRSRVVVVGSIPSLTLRLRLIRAPELAVRDLTPKPAILICPGTLVLRRKDQSLVRSGALYVGEEVGMEKMLLS